MKTAEWVAARQRLPVPLYGPGEPAAWQTWLYRMGSLIGDSIAHNTSTADSQNSSQKPKRLGDFQSEVIGNYVARLTARLNIDLVILQYVTLGYITEYIRRHQPATSVVIDTHDVMHSRKQAFQNLGRTHWLDIDRQSEAATLGACDAVIAIQSEDAREFSGMMPDQTVLIAPWACPLPDSEEANPGASRTVPVVGFLGSDGDANRLGLIEFLKHCWPLVRSRLANKVELLIAGPIDSSSTDLGETDGLVFTGAVEDLTTFYNSIDVAINPAIIHSGLKIKSLESLAWGVPLVTTSAGIAGIPAAVGQGALVADEWNQFAGEIARLLTQPELRTTFSRAARQVVGSQFGPDVAYAELVSWIRRNARENPA